jgi:glycine C-acetyltransferase
MKNPAVLTLEDPALLDYVTAGTVADYLREDSAHLLQRLNPHLQWWNARYDFGLDPYAKSTLGPIGPEVHAKDRLGRDITGINMASQDYLNLASHPDVKQAAHDAIDRYGVHSAGSATLMGNSQVSMTLADALSTFLKVSNCTLFPTGWAAGYGVIRALTRAHDHILIDALAHACLIEGARNSTKHVHRFQHNDLRDLELKLKDVAANSAGAGILIVTESLFSMDSDTPDLQRIQDLARAAGATLLVDVAHDLGSLGPQGRGHLEMQEMLGKVDIVMGSFSKTFASNGGFVATDHPALKQALHFASGPLTFSNAISPVQASVVLAALNIAASEEGVALRRQLMSNSLRLRGHLENKGLAVMGAASAIVPVQIGSSARSRLTCLNCGRRGAVVNLVEHPAVAQGSSRIRLQVMAGHTSAQIDAFVSILGSAIEDSDAELLRLGLV